MPAFDWGLPFGSKTIADALEAAGGLTLVEELRAPLYRVQRFQRPHRRRRRLAEVTEIELPPGIAPVGAGRRALGRDRLRPTPAVESEVSTSRLLILMYHRIADAGGDATLPGAAAGVRRAARLPARCRVQLRDTGRLAARDGESPAAARPARADHVRRRLRRFRHARVAVAAASTASAPCVFVVAGQVGGSNRWDGPGAEQFPLMSGEELRRLRDEGLEIGSHSVSHPFMTTLSPADVTREAARSRSILTECAGRAAARLRLPLRGPERGGSAAHRRVRLRVRVLDPPAPEPVHR